jgi:PAS domain-containing protein
MKHTICIFVCGILGIGGLHVQAQSPVVTPSGPHSSTWTWTETGWDDLGQPVTNEHSYIEVATALNFLSPVTQQWERSVEAFDLTREGYFVALRGQHRVMIAGNINAGGSVDLELPDGQRLRSNPMGLSFFSPTTGRNVLLAEVKDCPGELAEPNVVLFPSAFDTVPAAIVFKNTKSGFDQSVVMLANPGAPQEWGFAEEEDVRLEVWTEWFDPPQPALTTARTAEGLESETLDFGSMAMVEGRAFFLHQEMESVEVQKSWQRIRDADGRERDFLIESVPHRAVAPMLERLQARATKPDKAFLARRTTRGRSALAGLFAQRTKPTEGQLARVTRPAHPLESGFLIDYTILNTSQTNYVFKGDGTYYLSADVALYGTNTVFESGVVLKAATNVTLSVNTPITWGGTPFRPIVLTAKSDGSVGEPIGGTLTGYFAATALQIKGGATNTLALRNLRIAHARTAISIDGGANHVIRHAQVVNCQKGIAATNAEFSLRNALFHNVLTNFTGSSSTGRVEHLTSDIASWLNNSIGTNLYLTNCILAGVTNLGGTGAMTAVAQVSPSGVFQTVGAGYHYLASGSPYRDYAGASTNINVTLARELRNLTTYPPIVLTNHFTVNTTLSPQAQRDADGLLDLGWHYDPLDYCWSGLNLTNATLILTNGVAVGFYGEYGLNLRSQGYLRSEGTPTALNRLARYHAVQEQSYTWGALPAAIFNSDSGSPPASVNLAFTDVAALAGMSNQRRLITDTGSPSVNLSHCQVRGLHISFHDSPYSSSQTLNWFNTVFDRCMVNLTHYGTYPGFILDQRNNLFYRGNYAYSTYGTNTLSWTVKDCLFDCDSLTHWGEPRITNSNNGYLSGLSTLQGGSSNKTNLVIGYQAGLATNWYGVLGSFYYPTNGGASSLTNLFNAGSRYATNAGLYHFTTTTNQVKETNSVVDIGYHLVATDANGNPLDYDGDGSPDYFEDRNGNGTPDSGETGWQSASDTGLKVWITEPKNNSNLP